MLEILRELCTLDAVSGDEAAVRDYIINKIKNHCEYKIDPLGSIIAFKKGKKTPAKKVMLDAHMDEVGLIITYITDDGFLKFSAVGGIDTSVLMFRRVKVNGINGVISGKPIHLISADERKKLPDPHTLYIDIGASSKEDALKLVSPGDRAVICGEYTDAGDKIKSKALDDRIGCAVLISMLLKEAEYDFYAVFSVQEEVGLRGAKAAAYTVAPDAAIVLEGTTAADIAGVEPSRRVCVSGGGPAVSFMDRATVYDKAYYNAALKSGITCQPKAAVAITRARCTQAAAECARWLFPFRAGTFIHPPRLRISAILKTRCGLRNICLKAFAAAKLNDKACKHSARGFETDCGVYKNKVPF